jgi:NDP-sugar pyrophosphorylase family protein
MLIKSSGSGIYCTDDIKNSVYKISPLPSFSKRGNYSPFSKGGWRGIVSTMLFPKSSILNKKITRANYFLMKTINVFIPAAGQAERLRPISEYIPKPLLPILGKPVLQAVLERVSTLSLHKIGINLHNNKKIIEDWVVQSDFTNTIELFPEEHILGTGGALKNAETLLQKSMFLVHNADIVSDIDFEKLIEAHLSSKNLVTLAVHDYTRFNSVSVDGEGLLLSVGKKEILLSESARLLAFTGIGVYSPEFLQFLPSGASSVVNAWLKALSEGKRIGTYDVSGCFWSDIGTPRSYARAVTDLLRRSGETLFIHESSSGCTDAMLDGYVVIEKECSINEGVYLRNSIVLPGTHMTAHEQGGKEGLLFNNCILGPGFKVNLNESELFDSTEIPGALLIGTGGSERKYHRVQRDLQSAVIMQCGAGDKDFQRHIEYTKFFKEHSVPVPELLGVNPDVMTAIFEDLGDLSLYSWLKCKREQKQVEEIYTLAIDALIKIHGDVTENVSACPLLQNTIFDYDHLRWETGYFIERFVEGIRKKTIKTSSGLEDEFHRLALEVDSFPKTVMHRDFQSQNIMITKGKYLHLLDYQGARMGPPAYDLVSILWDPYYRLDDTIRQNLLDYYIKEGLRGINHDEFLNTILPCRLQRHMQALGAYGYLSVIKGKPYFQKFIPEGLRLLKEDVSLAKDTYPVLYALVMHL